MTNIVVGRVGTKDGGEADVVDFGIGTPFGASGDRDFVFAGEIVELRVAAQFAVESENRIGDVSKFVSVDTGERATGDVAGDVAAGSGGGEADGTEAVEDLGNGFDLDPMELNVLTNGDVGDTVAVFGGEVGDFVDLG